MNMDAMDVIFGGIGFHSCDQAVAKGFSAVDLSTLARVDYGEFVRHL